MNSEGAPAHRRMPGQALNFIGFGLVKRPQANPLEQIMENEMRAAPLIRMTEVDGRQWHVSEVGQAEPLASFGDIEAAVDYASEYAKSRGGRIVQHLD